MTKLATCAPGDGQWCEEEAVFAVNFQGRPDFYFMCAKHAGIAVSYTVYGCKVNQVRVLNKDTQFAIPGLSSMLDDLDDIKLKQALKRIKELEEEVRADDVLLKDRDALLAAIPECLVHGDKCVPHALDWIRQVRMLAR